MRRVLAHKHNRELQMVGMEDVMVQGNKPQSSAMDLSAESDGVPGSPVIEIEYNHNDLCRT